MEILFLIIKSKLLSYYTISVLNDRPFIVKKCLKQKIKKPMATSHLRICLNLLAQGFWWLHLTHDNSQYLSSKMSLILKEYSAISTLLQFINKENNFSASMNLMFGFKKSQYWNIVTITYNYDEIIESGCHAIEHRTWTP